MARGKRNINKVIIHHSASPVGTTVEQINQWHLDRGWSGIGYHYVLLEDCTIAKGRSLNKQGAHTKGENKNSIGICVTGNFEDYHCPAPRFSALMAHVSTLLCDYNLTWKDVYYHQQFANTACCGKFLIEQVKQFLKGRV